MLASPQTSGIKDKEESRHLIYYKIYNALCNVLLDKYHVTVDSDNYTMLQSHYYDFQGEDSTLVGSSVFGISDIYAKWKMFVQRRHAANDSRLLNSLP